MEKQPHDTDLSKAGIFKIQFGPKNMCDKNIFHSNKTKIMHRNDGPRQGTNHIEYILTARTVANANVGP